MQANKTKNVPTFLLDLDGTLYANDVGLWEAIGARINLFLAEHLGFDEVAVVQARQQYYMQYGTTLRGLMLHHKVNPWDYLAFVHDLPLENYLSANTELHQALATLPGKKWIFTNADAAHANRVLRAVGVPRSLFAGIIDIVRTGFVNKPDEEVYRMALEIAGTPPPSTCVMVDDQDRNLVPANQLGMHTVLVGPDIPNREAHHNISALHQLPAVLNGLVE